MSDYIENLPVPYEKGLLVPTAKTEARDNLYQDAYSCPANGWRPEYGGGLQEIPIGGGGFVNLPGGLRELDIVDSSVGPANKFIATAHEAGGRELMLKDFGALAHIPGVRDVLNTGLTIGRWLR